MADDREGVEIGSLQTAGELIDIKDKKGRRWSVPAESLDQYASVHRRSALDLKLSDGDDKDFDIQWKTEAELGDCYRAGFIHVEPDDVGMLEGVAVKGADGEPIEKIRKVYGAQLQNAIKVGDLYAMKAPKVLIQRLDRESKKIAKEVVASIGPTPKMLRQMKEEGIQFVAEGQPVQVDEPLPRGDLDSAPKIGME